MRPDFMSRTLLERMPNAELAVGFVLSFVVWLPDTGTREQNNGYLV